MSIKEKIENYKTIYVHSGAFHSDDLLSVAFIQMLNPDIKVKRISEVNEQILKEASNNQALVCDIGGKYNFEKNLFDHHQKDESVFSEKPSWDKTESKNFHSSFGLLWKNFGDYFCQKYGYSEKTKEKFYDYFVSQIDAVDNGIRKNAETKFPNLVRSIFIPTTWELMNGDENKKYNEAFMNSIDYGKQCIEKTFKDINLYLNQGKDEKEMSVKDFTITRNKIANSKLSQISRNPKYHLPRTVSESMSYYAREVLNINKSESKLISEISQFNSKITKKLDFKDISIAVEHLEYTKQLSKIDLNSSGGVLKLPRKMSVANMKDIFGKAHWINKYSETKPLEVVHRFEIRNRPAVIQREEKMIEYAKEHRTNFFVYDGDSNRYFSPDYQYISSLDTIMEEGGLLYIRQTSNNSQNIANIEKMKETIKSGKYVKSTGEIINVSSKTYVFIEAKNNTINSFEKQKEIRKFEPKISEDFKKIDVPFAISYKQRNCHAIKFCVDIGENLYKFNDITAISNTLFLTEKNKIDIFGTIALLSSKHYYDKVNTNGIEFNLKNSTKTMLSKQHVYETIKEPQILQKILETCKISQFLTLKEKFEKDKKITEIQKSLIEEKENQIIEKIKSEAKIETNEIKDLKNLANLCKEKSYTAFETNLVFNDYETKMKITERYNSLTFEKDNEIIKSKDFISQEDFYDIDDFDSAE